MNVNMEKLIAAIFNLRKILNLNFMVIFDFFFFFPSLLLKPAD